MIWNNTVKIFVHLLWMWLVRVLAQALLYIVKQYAAPAPGLTSSTHDVNKPSLQKFAEHKQTAQMRCLYCCGSPHMYIKLVSQLKTSFSRSTACTHNCNGQIAPTKVQHSDTNRQATCCHIRTVRYRNWLNNAQDPWFTTLPPPLKNLFVHKQARETHQISSNRQEVP